jgi:hypothetical protein
MEDLIAAMRELQANTKIIRIKKEELKAGQKGPDYTTSA